LINQHQKLINKSCEFYETMNKSTRFVSITRNFDFSIFMTFFNFMHDSANCAFILETFGFLTIFKVL